MPGFHKTRGEAKFNPRLDEEAGYIESSALYDEVTLSA
jgi:hypothetical protein